MTTSFGPPLTLTFKEYTNCVIVDSKNQVEKNYVFTEIIHTGPTSENTFSGKEEEEEKQNRRKCEIKIIVRRNYEP